MPVIRQFQAEKAEADRLLRANPALSAAECASQLYDSGNRYFGKVDAWLDKSSNEPYWLRKQEVAEVTAGSLHFFDGRFYRLWCFCIMPNHVHLLLSTLPESPALSRVLQRVKSFSGLKSNRILGRSGAFWEEESYDHVVRNPGEFERIWSYIVQNPVKARLVDSWEKWPATFISSDEVSRSSASGL